jgi:hypothetical protein
MGMEIRLFGENRYLTAQNWTFKPHHLRTTVMNASLTAFVRSRSWNPVEREFPGKKHIQAPLARLNPSTHVDLVEQG